MEQKLFVGYSRVDITPEQYTHLGGNGLDSKRLCNKVIEHIYGTCIAMSDAQGSTVLYCPVDLLHTRNPVGIETREAISQATGVPVSHILLAASHNHAGPGVSSSTLDTVAAWKKLFIKRMVQCAEEAMADRKEAQMSIGQRTVEGMNFVRHYHMNDGTVAGPNSGSFASGAKAHLTEADNQLQVIRFQRQEGRDVILVNWQCHATSAAGTDIYAMFGDYIFHMRNHVEGITGAHFGFFQGAAGNLVPSSRIKGETRVVPSAEYDRYGRVMAEEVVACLADMIPVAAGPVAATSCVFSGQVDHSDDHLAEKAAAALKKFHAYPFDERVKAKELFLIPEGFNSHLHAGGIITRSQMGQTKEMELWAVRVGSVGFASAPYEMFCSNGMFIKKNSPFQMTFVVTVCNDYNAYMADDQAYDYDIYEINTRHYVRGNAEKLAQTFVDMLRELKK